MKVLSQPQIRRGLIAVIALSAIGVVAAAAMPPTTWPPPPMPPPVPGCSDYCYNVDIKNNTTFNANDLHVTLWGPTGICSHYLDSANPFGMPAMSVVDGNRMELTYASSTASVAPGQIAHIGFCTNSPVTGMVTGHNAGGLPPFYWTQNRTYIGDIVAVGHAWEAVRTDIGISPVVDVINTTPRNIHIRQLDWAVVDQAIELNHLMWDEQAQQVKWQPVLKDAVLSSGTEDAPGFLRMPLPLVFQPGDPRHVVFRVWAEDPKDLQNMNRGLGQASLASLAEQASQVK